MYKKSDIAIRSSTGSYQINFEAISQKVFENAYTLIDQNLQMKFELNVNFTICVSSKESSKNLSTVENIILQLSDKGMAKNSKLVVVGGGYLQDVGTLVASLYMRGVTWIYIPTTLAAMGDSCIGGKSSINAGSVKNLIGNFYPPNQVLIDTSFVSTLPDLEIVAGISEIIKICFAKSYETFTECSKLVKEWTTHANQDVLAEIIRISLQSKQYFVEIDEFDVGERKLLNFGHSFGHALESASKYKIPHGISVLLGMIAASLHPLSEASEKNNALIDTCLSFSKLIGKEFAHELSNIDFEVFSSSLRKDKKNSSSELTLVLPFVSGLGIVKIPFGNNALEDATVAMKSAIEMVLNEIC